MGRNSPPSEDEHYAAYTAVARALENLPLIVRTLDIGGDKPIPYLGMATEANPFLGWRGIRFCLDRPDLFRPQLRALLRASVDYNIQIMLPMVSTVTEVQQARQLLAEIQTELHHAGMPAGGHAPVGIMIETPAAVLMAAQLAREVDFFSIGTNDLTQYTLAADRGNARVAGLVNALQPAILHSIQQVAQAAHKAGIWVGVCGEMAGNPAAAALLVGLGIDELSMAPPAIPAVKARLRELTATQAAQLAEQALTLATAAEIEQLLHSDLYA
jgi:phosphocarrier protein FPr